MVALRDKALCVGVIGVAVNKPDGLLVQSHQSARFGNVGPRCRVQPVRSSAGTSVLRIACKDNYHPVLQLVGLSVQIGPLNAKLQKPFKVTAASWGN